MRLLIVGRLSSELVTASKIAMNRGASVTHADGIDQGLATLRAKGGDLVMVDVGLDIRRLVQALSDERIRTPVVACGIASDARAAVAAIQAGAKEYIPLPPDPELIAAVLEAVAADAHLAEIAAIELRCFGKTLLREALLLTNSAYGIAEAQLPKLFGMFQRFHDHVEGTGIGLYMVKRMVENAGGRIEVHSQLGAGTTFFVFLPHDAPPAGAPPFPAYLPS